MLVSEKFGTDDVLCVQFWYHMYGKEIGSLTVHQTTNTTKETIWSLSGDQGNLWRFGQVATSSADYPYQVND